MNHAISLFEKELEDYFKLKVGSHDVFYTDLDKYLKQINTTEKPQSGLSKTDLQNLSSIFSTHEKKIIQDKTYQNRCSRDPLNLTYGLFGTHDYGRLETAHTNFIAWLINPTADHGLGQSFIKIFLESAKIPNFVPGYVQGQKTFDGGRIDLFIESYDGKYAIVIEAKIDSKESKNQLNLYENFLKKRNYEKSKKILLVPLDYCRIGGEEDWIELTWDNLAYTWRDVYKSLRKGHTCEHIISLYIAEIFKSILGWPIPFKEPLTLRKKLYLQFLKEKK